MKPAEPAEPAATGDGRRWLGLAVVGLALMMTTWLAVRVNQLSQLYFAQFALYLVAVVLLLRRPPADWGRRRWVLIFGVALVIRLIYFFSRPSLSDDLYRYIWDGKLINAGLNPYLWTAEDPSLAALRGPLWAGIAAKETFTVYQPVSELAFGLAYRMAPESFKAMQALGGLADLAVIGLIALLLPRFGVRRERVLIYAWSPLPALHYVHSGHNDPLMIAGLLLTIYCLLRKKSALSGAAFAISVLAKLPALLLAPVFLRSWGWRGVVAGSLVGGLLYAPFLSGGPAILQGLSTEAGDRIFNDGGQFVIRWFVQLFIEDGRAVARTIAGLIVLTAGIWLLLRPDRRPAALWQRSFFLLGLFLLVAPMVQPWYLGWILPFLCLSLRPGSEWRPLALSPSLGWLLWTGTVEATDFSYGSDIPYLWWYLRGIQYLPIFLLLAGAGVRCAFAERTRWATRWPRLARPGPRPAPPGDVT